jgi:ElaB/YqjD/DUF883 family membrane-anchored ribosome-binding protein
LSTGETELPCEAFVGEDILLEVFEMGELLDSLNGVGSDSGAIDPPISSVIDEATESFIGRDGAAIRQGRTAAEMVSGWVRQAPLQSLAVAFLLGAALSRRRR